MVKTYHDRFHPYSKKANFGIGHCLYVVLALGHCPNSLWGETLHKCDNLPVDTALIKIIISG